MTLGAIALVASGAFSIGEITGAHRTDRTNGSSSAPAPSPSGSSGLSDGSGLAGGSGLPGLSGLSLSGLQKLANQVSQAAAIAPSTGSHSPSADLLQLERQLGISPSQSAQLRAELNAINACLGGSSSAPPNGC